MQNELADIVAAAGQAAAAGRWNEAERLWQRVLQADPKNTRALSSLGVHALQRGDIKRGLKHLESARRVAPDDLFVLNTLIDVYAQTGELQQERNCIEAALAVDAYFVPALLARGNWFEKVGKRARAASDYANALKISPAEAQWPEAYRAALGHAKAVVEKNAGELNTHLLQAMQDDRSFYTPWKRATWTDRCTA